MEVGSWTKIQVRFAHAASFEDCGREKMPQRASIRIQWGDGILKCALFGHLGAIADPVSNMRCRSNGSPEYGECKDWVAYDY